MNGEYAYRTVLSEYVELIDPAVETAKEAYFEMRKMALENQSEKKSNVFFITTPNSKIPEAKLQTDGWFTYEYKYGRNANENKKFVNFVPFDNKNISTATYERLKSALPAVYKSIINH
jgi:threonine aldolase